jgi:hypothetical protein
MPIRILHGDIHLIDLKTRLPFKYGIATMTQAPQALVRLYVEVDGREVTGVSADILPPKWFTKIPDKPLDDEIFEMLEVIEHAVACSAGISGPTAFEIWRAVHDEHQRWGQERALPPLLSQFGTTLVERALIEAFCRVAGKSFGDCVRDGSLGIRLDAVHPQLAGKSPHDLLPEQARRRIIARHTVGMADPLTDEEIEPSARLSDGLPQSLAACIQQYGLTHFKLKVSGRLEQDIDRLVRTLQTIERYAARDYQFTLDGNESFHSLDALREYWTVLAQVPGLADFRQRLIFVEQPFHRDVALDAEVLRALPDWKGRPTLIIDESDAELDSLPRAIKLGYHGTSHKNCKGVFKGVANACLLQWLKSQSGDGRLVMSGEDLANIGPVALLQDLAVIASLGVASVERNGHHYFAGLSAFPEAVQQAILEHHGDLYDQGPQGWPTLRITGGELNLESVIHSPLGVGFQIDVNQFTPAAEWKKRHASATLTP